MPEISSRIRILIRISILIMLIIDEIAAVRIPIPAIKETEITKDVNKAKSNTPKSWISRGRTAAEML
jgi:hypothetical protein